MNNTNVPEIKDEVAVNSGVHEGLAWKSTVCLTAEGEYIAHVKVGTEDLYIPARMGAESAKWDGLSKVAEILGVE